MITTVNELVERVARLRRGRNRLLIGVVGEPCGGKSTVSAAIVDRLGTFDGSGYLHLVRRLREGTEPVGYAPEYEDLPWCDLRQLLEKVWYIAVPQSLRIEQLVQRHIRFGMTETSDRAWATDVDEVNARRVRAMQDRADLVIELTS